MFTSPWQKPFRGMQINKAHPLARGLVGCWVMNGATGDKVFDLSGYGTNGTNNGADWVADGLEFVKTDPDYVAISTNPIISALSNISVEMLFKTDLTDGGSNGAALYCERNAATPIWKLQIKQLDTPIQFVHRDNASTLTFVSGTVNICDGNYHHIIMTKIGTSIKFYVDGKYDNGGALNGSDTLTAGNVRFGSDAQDAAAYFDGITQFVRIYNRALSLEEVAWLYRGQYAMFEQPISPASLYYEAVGDVSTDLLHGKIIIKDSSIVLVDGLLQIKDIATDLADGKIKVQDKATGLTDGLLSVQDKATGLADGKVQIQDSVIDLADGKVIVTTVGDDTGLADGKIQIKDVTTGIVDGIIKVKDSVTGLADGKVKISNIGSNLADGLIQIKDTVTGIADGKVQIKDVATGTADGLLKIIERATSNVDGKLKIKDTIKNLADGKISITGVAVAVIRRITIANKKPSYRLVAEQPKPTYRLKTENK